MKNVYRNIIVIAALALGGVISRIHGGGIIKADKAYKNLAWTLPLTAIACYASGWWGLIALACMLKATGHGQWFSLGRAIKYISPERLDFLLVPFFGADPRTDKGFKGLPENHPAILSAMQDYGRTRLYWRCVVGMTFKGLVSVLGCAIALAITSPLAGLLCALGGLLCGAMYAIGWAIWPTSYKDQATELGEWAGGALAYGLTFMGVLYG